MNTRLKTIEKNLKKQGNTLNKWQIIRTGSYLNYFFHKNKEAEKRKIEIINYLDDNEINLTPEHNEQGKNFLTKFCFKKNGELRKPFMDSIVNSGHIWQTDKDIAESFSEGVKELKDFTFIGFKQIAFNPYTGPKFSPAYRLNTESGQNQWVYSYAGGPYSYDGKTLLYVYGTQDGE